MKLSLCALALLVAAAQAAPAKISPPGEAAKTDRKALLKAQNNRFAMPFGGKALPEDSISVATAIGSQDGETTGACGQYATEVDCRDVAPETANCIWSLPHGSSSDWDEEDEVCRSMRCSDVENIDISAGDDEAAACAAFLGGTCTWQATEYTCWETGQELPCEFKGAWEQSMCPSPCVWNEGNYNHPCSTAGSHEPCGQAYDSASCETTSNPDCRWQAGADANDENGCGSCYNATRYGADAPCDAFFTKPHSCCPTDRCHWTVVMEAPDGSNDMPDYGEEGDGRCTAETEALACEQYEDEADCPRPRCEFVANDYDGICLAAGRKVPCSRLEVRTCSEEISCNWVGSTVDGEQDMGMCSDCPTTNCTQPYVGPGGPDDGAPCAQHTSMNCPMDDFPPRCAIHYPGEGEDDGGMDYNDWECSSAGGGDDGTCGEPVCDDLYEEDACTTGGIAGCSWDASIYACYKTTDGLPCDRIFEQTSCTDTCSWAAAAAGCADDGMGDGGSCVNTANPNPPCKSFDVLSAACCPAHCTWQQDTATCTAGDYVKSCESFGSHISGTDACPTDRCAVSHGVCHGQDVTIGCGDICNKFICTSSGDCHWNEDAESNECVDGGAALADCSTLDENSCYNEEHCAYLGGTCAEGVCTDIFSEEVCGAWSGAPHNCIYNANHGCSFANEALQCDAYYEASTCNSATGSNCHYDQTCYLCLDEGEECPCHLFWDQGACPSDRCTWTDSYTCELNTDGDTPPALSGGGDHDMASCTSAMKTNLRPVLDAAAQDCVDMSGTSGPASADQIKCLDYYVKHAATPSTLTDACPCLWYWAQHEAPEYAYWMNINC